MRIKPGKNKPSFGSIRIIANERIIADQVRVLNEFGDMIGIMSKSEALGKAREADKDLVLLNQKADPVIVKMIDLAKYKYQEQQKAAKSRKNAKAQETKEVRLTPFMSSGDLEARIKKILGFLEKGDKVRLGLLFKGREITKKEFGFDIFAKVIAATADEASVELEPKLIGKKLMAQLMPLKSKKG